MSRRSVLFSPGDRPELLRKATDSAADTVVFDLEDAVSPSKKEKAREAIRETLTNQSVPPDTELTVRINSGETAETDLGALVDTPLDTVMVPKVSGPEDISAINNLLAEHRLDCPIIALIESAAGILNAPAIAEKNATSALAFGAEDFVTDIGATRTAEGTELLCARERVVLAATAADIDAIDTVFTRFEDIEGLRQDTKSAVELGFEGKLAIHPKQVPIINQTFTPDEKQVEWAQRVLRACEETDGEQAGVFEVDGEMIDGPLLAQAEQILERAGVDRGDL